jgi:imidazole glycerol-phosphate synthase subunit HisH
MQKAITIIDYGMANLGSIANMLKKLGVQPVIAADPAVAGRATKLILPGIGAFDHGMQRLRERGFVDVLNAKVLEEKVPVLGICLGAQLITASSEEGILPGLGWLDACTVRFDFSRLNARPKIPHMGWNTVRVLKQSPLYEGMPAESRFYFVHSYHVACNDPADRLTETTYGMPFTSSVQRDNILGAQFHPEKSHRFGLQLLRNFVERF